MAITRLLRIEAPHMVAGVVMERERNGHGWQASRTEIAPILSWMAGKSAVEICNWLRRKNYKYQWVDK